MNKDSSKFEYNASSTKKPIKTDNNKSFFKKFNSHKQKKSNNNPMSTKNISKNEISSKLSGRTLIIYFYLLNKKKTGVRDLQKSLGLSSPSVAKYHLDKIVELNLASNENGVYFLKKKANLPILTSWILLGKNLYPKFLFYAIFFSVLFLCYFLFFFHIWHTDSVFVFIFGILIIIVSWYETILQFKRKPF